MHDRYREYEYEEKPASAQGSRSTYAQTINAMLTISWLFHNFVPLCPVPVIRPP